LTSQYLTLSVSGINQTDEHPKGYAKQNLLIIGENIMRKITKESSEAFVNFEQFKKDNTEVSSYEVYDSEEIDPSIQERTSAFYLHGNRIAFLFRREVREAYETKEEFSINIDLCGYHTRTTRERINGILDALGYDFRIAQRNHEQVLIKQLNPFPQALLDEFKLHNAVTGAKEKILKLSDDSFDPEFAKRVFLSREFVSGTDLNAITDF
tara:strand:- start:14 stop:643 length:630 start_codon:yes stop_codon:yes gene_type:complete